MAALSGGAELPARAPAAGPGPADDDDVLGLLAELEAEPADDDYTLGLLAELEAEPADDDYTLGLLAELEASPAAAALPPAAKASSAAAQASTAAAKASPAAAKASPGGAEEMRLASIRDHVLSKGMWAGILTRTAIPDLAGMVAAGHVARLGRPHTPALLKVFDEIIVNATDQARAHPKGRNRVSRIEITFAAGRVTVFNDGPGIPARPHPAASAAAGRPVYLPEVAFAYFLAGTNIEKAADNIKGGTNGLGAKLANVHSLVFEVETCAEGRVYRQRWEDRLAVTRPPSIEAGGPLGFTRVSFLPAYGALGYPPGEGGPLAPEDAADLEAWLRLRALQAAAYVGGRVAVAYNGAPCPAEGAAGLARLPAAFAPRRGTTSVVAPVTVMSAAARSGAAPYDGHPWDVAAAVLPAASAPRKDDAPWVGIVNGVVCSRGPHVAHVRRLLRAACAARLARAAPKSELDPDAALAFVRVAICAAVPGADWGGQRKDELQLPRGVAEGFSLPRAFLDRVGALAADQLLARAGLAEGARPKGAPLAAGAKYTPARHAGRARRADTLLFAAEGDSAIALLRAGFASCRDAPPGGPSFDWCGIISLQGVVLNAAREVAPVTTAGGETLLIRSDRLRNNARLAALAAAMGLRYGVAYETPEELASLNYGTLVLCVDQDLDGAGKIASLVLVWVHLFWPALLRAGRVARFVTPLIRAYRPGARRPRRGGLFAPGTDPCEGEFYYESEFRRWLAARGADAPALTFKYYKGLAAHDGAAGEVARMFSPAAFAASLLRYVLEPDAARLFDLYFGPDAAARRAVLAAPAPDLAPEVAAAMRRDRAIPVGGVQLSVDTRQYKAEAVHRQLPGVLDGLNPARRKVLCGALSFLRDELKVFQLGGRVAADLFYHHGNASLEATITRMAECYPGALRYPFLEGSGQFGTRHGGKAGSPRYVGVRLAPLATAAFPAADFPLLPRVSEDGKEAEPCYYVPVAPLAVLETYRIVTEGWRFAGFGRALAPALAAVRAFIAGDPALCSAADELHAAVISGAPLAGPLSRVGALEAAWPLPAEVWGFTAPVVLSGDLEVSLGAAEFGARAAAKAAPKTAAAKAAAAKAAAAKAAGEAPAQPGAPTATVVITELPQCVPTGDYVTALAAREEHVAEVVDYSSAERVELAVRLTPAGVAAAAADLTEFLRLRSPLRPYLNYNAPTGRILELGRSYLAALLLWAVERRDLYLARLRREHTLARLRALERAALAEYLRLGAAEAAGTPGRFQPRRAVAASSGAPAAAAALAAGGFVPVDSALLHSPGRTPAAELEARVLRGAGANFGYLLDLRERDFLADALARREAAAAAEAAEAARLEAALAERPIPGASIWLGELAEFESRVLAWRADAEAARS